MKDLSIYTIGVKGGKAKESKQGYISVYAGNDKLLSIDNYSGQGATYKQRENPVIVILDGETVIFEGTHEQLINKLK